ncbi:MAG: metallopeptidase TldD-related protein [Candidatus Hodarchaeales archaeon]|jgi:PmbA protein
MDDTLKSFVDSAVSTGQKQNVDLILGLGSQSVNNQIRFSQNKIDINKQWQSDLIDLIVVVEGNQVSIGSFSPRDETYVKERVNAQIKFAQKMTPSPFFMGVESVQHSIDQSAFREHFDPRIVEYREKAPQVINTCIDEAINTGATRVAGSFLFGENSYYLSSSAGPSGSYQNTFYNLTVRAFQDELDASGQGLACGRIPNSAEKELVQAAGKAGRFSKSHKNAQQAKPGLYDIIMSPAVGANVLGNIPQDANPLLIMMGRSSLGDKIGEKLAPDFVNIEDNGLQPGGLATSPIDIEGTPRSSTSIFNEGVLKSYIHNTTTGNMFQAESTGNGAFVNFGMGSKIMAPAPTNVVFNNGDYSFDELLDTSRNTLYVTCNWYTRFTSRISTEYSTIPRDAAFLVVNGELSTPVKNFRISDKILNHFANIDAMGNDRVQVKWWEVGVPTWIPTIRVKDCRVTTATQ